MCRYNIEGGKKMLCLRLLLGAFFLFILLSVVCVLFGGIAIWYSWVKFLEVFRRCGVCCRYLCPVLHHLR